MNTRLPLVLTSAEVLHVVAVDFLCNVCITKVCPPNSFNNIFDFIALI